MFFPFNYYNKIKNLYNKIKIKIKIYILIINNIKYILKKKIKFTK